MEAGAGGRGARAPVRAAARAPGELRGQAECKAGPRVGAREEARGSRTVKPHAPRGPQWPMRAEREELGREKRNHALEVRRDLREECSKRE